MISIKFDRNQLADALSESVTVRLVVINALLEAQSTNSKYPPGLGEIVEKYRGQSDRYIECIKEVRFWRSNNLHIDLKKFGILDDIGSLGGARDWVKTEVCPPTKTE